MVTQPNLSAPRLSGTMRESPLYGVLGVGLTDRVFLIGHTNGLEINDPYRVVSIQEAVNRMGADPESPLLRAMLECYYAGCRDIWLVATATMGEYVPDVANRNTNHAQLGNTTFYKKYFQRLVTTYQFLLDWDLPQIIIPVEASFHGATQADFLTQLASHCAAAFAATSAVRIGMLGTRGTMDPTAVNTMVADARIPAQGPNGKFVVVIPGDGTMNIKELPTMYSTSVVPSVAGQLSTMTLDRGMTYLPIRNVMNTTHGDMKKADVERLSQAKLNPLIRLTAGKRGTPFKVVMATDNTMGQDGSDYWSLLQVRLVAKVVERVRGLGRGYIGTPNFADFRTDVTSYLSGLRTAGAIRDYTAVIRRDEDDRSKILVDLLLRPFYGLREITFTVEVGPSGVVV